ncbi:hypothetical protein PENSPDRAFT_469234 [Peniophora sp. CONT]|nr:hypothetical protein PENSPDRAFT_469234 [Peniophora sp. CONT]
MSFDGSCFILDAAPGFLCRSVRPLAAHEAKLGPRVDGGKEGRRRRSLGGRSRPDRRIYRTWGDADVEVLLCREEGARRTRHRALERRSYNICPHRFHTFHPPHRTNWHARCQSATSIEVFDATGCPLQTVARQLRLTSSPRTLGVPRLYATPSPRHRSYCMLGDDYHSPIMVRSKCIYACSMTSRR